MGGEALSKVGTAGISYTNNFFCQKLSYVRIHSVVLGSIFMVAGFPAYLHNAPDQKREGIARLHWYPLLPSSASGC
jgi:hypothetical protein